jgi:hypothetical protein
MNRLATASFVALLCSVTLAAQSPAPAPTPNSSQSAVQKGKRTYQLGLDAKQLDTDAKQISAFSFIAMPASNGCPVSMRAQQRGGGDLLSVNRSQDNRSDTVAQRIHLVLENTAANLARITGGRVTVHGTSAKPRSIVAGIAQDGMRDATKTFTLSFDIGENEAASANLLLRGFTSVQSVTLEAVTYADGSSWSPSSGKTCRVSPDPLVLVSGR